MKRTIENCSFAMATIIGIIVTLFASHTMAANVHENRSKIKINFNGNTIMRDGTNKPIIDAETTLNQQFGNQEDIVASRTDDSSDFVSIEIDDQLSIKDQIRALTQQMSNVFQHEWKVTMRKAAKELLEADFQSQLAQLR